MTKRVEVWVTTDLLLRLDRRSLAQGLTISRFVRNILARYEEDLTGIKYPTRKPRTVRVTKKIGRTQRIAVWEKSEGLCEYCGVLLDRGDWHVDHRTPLCHGGTNDDANLAASCPACNLRKGGRERAS